MKTYRSKFVLMVSFVMSMISCSTKIPVVNDINTYHQNPYGAYIEVKVQGVQDILKFKGELISADAKKIILRTLDIPNVVRPFATKDIKSYKVYFTYEKHVGTTPFFIINSLTTLTHGYFLLITLPANLGVMALIENNKNNNFIFTSKEMSLNQLYKFARFPSGLPPGINLNNLQDLIK